MNDFIADDADVEAELQQQLADKKARRRAKRDKSGSHKPSIKELDDEDLDLVRENIGGAEHKKKNRLKRNAVLEAEQVGGTVKDEPMQDLSAVKAVKAESRAEE